MIIDCHFHLEEDIIAVDSLVSHMENYGVDKIALMPSCVEPFPDPPKFLTNFLQFLLKQKSLRRLGEKFCADFTTEGAIKLPGGTYRIYAEPENWRVFQVVRSYPTHFWGWVFVNPNSGQDQSEEIQNYQDQPGFVGIKAHPFWHRYPPVKLVPAAELAASMDKPLLLHLGFGEHGNLDQLIKEVPEAKIILAHAAFPFYKDYWHKVRKNPNLYVDLSQTSYVNEKTIEQAVQFLGAEKCLFGTDGPFGIQKKDGSLDYGLIQKRIQRQITHPSLKKRVLGENFRELSGLL